NHLAAADVVGHEQRLGAADDQVVDGHPDQVEPDRVVLVPPLRARAPRADPAGPFLSIRCAIATLVPTPSVLVASNGRLYAVSRLASNSPANPPSPPTTSGREAFATHFFISSTARSPPSMSPPAAAYDAGSLVGGRFGSPPPPGPLRG